MMNNIFENSFKIRYSEMDCNLVLKPSSLLQLLQDVASEDAQNKDFGYSFLTKKNLGWFLLKYHIEFLEYPREVYNLKIETESRGYNKLFAFRDFKMYNNEKLIGEATTTWGLVDFNSKAMVNIPEVLTGNNNISLFEKREDDLKYNKIAPIKEITNQRDFVVRFDDLDVNQHVNNSNYILWALEALDFNYRKNKNIKTLDMLFKKEAKYNEEIISVVEVMDNLTVHLIKNKETDEELCSIQIIWE